MKNRALTVSLIVIAALHGVVGVSFGRQVQTTGAIGVTVSDPTGLPVPNALCSLFRSSDSKTVIATVTTDEQGIASFAAILPGSYSIRIERSGFETLLKKDVVLPEKG